MKARRDSWGWRQGWRRKRPWRTRPPELYIFIDEYDSYIYSLLTRLPALQEPTDTAREDLDSGVPVVTALNQLKSLEAADLVSRFMIIGLARVKWADASKANNIDLLSAETSFGDACGLGLDDIKGGLDYLNLTEAQTLEALKLMKHCFNGYRFPGVGIGADDGLYNAQLCNRFLKALCVEENLRWLDPSDDEHWAKLTDSALVARMNDDQSDPPWAMLQLLARSGKAAADLLVLANGGSLEHSEDLLQQRYSIKALLDNSQLLERPDAVAATRNFMYDNAGVRRYINHAHFGRCPGASSPTFCLGRHNKTCSDLQSKTRRRALQSDCGAQRLFECARLERRILGVLRRTGACSSALPHTPTRRELFCRRIVGPEMARIGFERNAALEERVFTIAFLSLMDGLKPIHSRRERRVH